MGREILKKFPGLYMLVQKMGVSVADLLSWRERERGGGVGIRFSGILPSSELYKTEKGIVFAGSLPKVSYLR